MSCAALTGKLVALERLAAEHTPELVTTADDPAIWRYLSSHVKSPAEMRSYIDTLLRGREQGSVLPFAVRSRSSGRLVGMTRFKDLSREHRKALVGTWFIPDVWGMGCNSEAKLLLLAHGFEELGLLRIEFQTDSRNQRSRGALAAMGAVEEGTLRSYVIAPDGHRRDTVVFSVLESDWPEVKRRLTARLAAQAG